MTDIGISVCKCETEVNWIAVIRQNRVEEAVHLTNCVICSEKNVQNRVDRQFKSKFHWFK